VESLSDENLVSQALKDREERALAEPMTVRPAALSNPRRTWLPTNGLEQLRRLAEQRGLRRSPRTAMSRRGPSSSRGLR
jgi:hypothetical protein